MVTRLESTSPAGHVYPTAPRIIVTGLPPIDASRGVKGLLQGLVDITGDSYRMRTHRAHAAKLRNATHQPGLEEANAGTD